MSEIKRALAQQIFLGLHVMASKRQAVPDWLVSAFWRDIGTGGLLWGSATIERANCVFTCAAASGANPFREVGPAAGGVRQGNRTVFRVNDQTDDT
ncbi:hypothetical protein [Fluviibacter phosphoraccumulans]|uniref:hypothetical protein n=1 Tax=Fluviibacter phosphoraccumulans TaxID=1751046 RepID=UPI0013669735|nr:hypothetical protein [Fluviibacter phosphoraccumulans]BBU71584.1 hypothetical protein ICHIJ1_15030 [Fluviibacter phosphoraccumulans]